MDSRIAGRVGKTMVIILILCFFSVLFPKAVFASSVKKPGQVKSISVETRQSESGNTAKVNVRWTKVRKNCTGYQIYQKTGNGKWKRIKTVKKSRSSISIAVKSGKKYRFKVRAVNRKKKGKKYKTAKGKFSISVSVSIGESGKAAGSGNYDMGMTEIVADPGNMILSLVFEFTNLDKYEKNPDDYFLIKAIQNGKELSLSSGSLFCKAAGSKTVRQPLTFALNSEESILLQIISKEKKGDIIDELKIPIK